MTSATERPSWRKTCSMCGAYYAPYCYGIDLQSALDAVEDHNRERGRYGE